MREISEVVIKFTQIEWLIFGYESKPWYLVNPKIAGKWMFIPLKMVLIGIDPYPNIQKCSHTHRTKAAAMRCTSGQRALKAQVTAWIRALGRFESLAASVSSSNGMLMGYKWDINDIYI